MDDYGDALHWLDQVNGFRSLGLYGWCDDDKYFGLVGSIDFSDDTPYKETT